MAIVFLFLSTSASSDLKPWVLKLNEDAVKVYQFKDKVDTTASIQELDKTIIDFNDPNLKAIIDALKVNKAESLKYAGISNWEVRETSINAKVKTIIFIGSYIDSNFKKIDFREEHRYQESKTVQILLTWPKTFKAGSKVASEFIKIFDEGDK